jgi:hypothetical protein
LNIFKTIEAYKKIPYLQGREDQLRVCRGVWVSGIHTDPYTIDGVIHIQAVSSNQTETRVYTETTAETGWDGQTMYPDFYAGKSSIKTYYSESHNLPDEFTVAVTGMYDQPFSYVDYIQSKKTFDDKPYVQITDLYTEGEPTITDGYYPAYADSSLEQVLHILDFSSSALEYSIGN